MRTPQKQLSQNGGGCNLSTSSHKGIIIRQSRVLPVCHARYGGGRTGGGRNSGGRGDQGGRAGNSKLSFMDRKPKEIDARGGFFMRPSCDLMTYTHVRTSTPTCTHGQGRTHIKHAHRLHTCFMYRRACTHVLTHARTHARTRLHATRMRTRKLLLHRAGQAEAIQEQ